MVVTHPEAPAHVVLRGCLFMCIGHLLRARAARRRQRKGRPLVLRAQRLLSLALGPPLMARVQLLDIPTR